MNTGQLLDRLLPDERDKGADTAQGLAQGAPYATYWIRLRPLNSMRVRFPRPRGQTGLLSRGRGRASGWAASRNPVAGPQPEHSRDGVPGPFLKPGDVLGHEPMGIVEETGPDITRLRAGDRVVVPFNISCGHCRMCRRGLFAQCETI